MEASIAEPQQIAANERQSDSTTAERDTAGKSWLFSRETAIAANRKSVEARRKREVEAETAKAIVHELKASAIVAPEDEYRLERLQRTREQLKALDEDFAAETDPKAKKAICDSMRALCEIERNLAMRPLPGSHRPSSIKPTKRGPIAPLETPD